MGFERACTCVKCTSVSAKMPRFRKINLDSEWESEDDIAADAATAKSTLRNPEDSAAATETSAWAKDAMPELRSDKGTSLSLFYGNNIGEFNPLHDDDVRDWLLKIDELSQIYD